MQLRVLVDVGGHVGGAVAALVGREHTVASLAERVELVSPRVPALREAVAEHDRRAVFGPALGDVHADAVGVDVAVTDRVERGRWGSHGVSVPWCRGVGVFRGAAMRSVAWLVRQRLARRWLAWVGVGVLLGVGFGVSLAAFNTAVRTSSAYDRVLRDADAPDASIAHDLSGDEAEEVFADIDGIVGQRHLVGFMGWIEGVDPALARAMLVAESARFPIEKPRLRAGRLPRADRADEVVVNGYLADGAGLEVGQRIQVNLLAPPSFTEVTTVPVTVVGIGTYRATRSSTRPGATASWCSARRSPTRTVTSSVRRHLRRSRARRRRTRRHRTRGRGARLRAPGGAQPGAAGGERRPRPAVDDPRGHRGAGVRRHRDRRRGDPSNATRTGRAPTTSTSGGSGWCAARWCSHWSRPRRSPP